MNVQRGWKSANNGKTMLVLHHYCVQSAHKLYSTYAWATSSPPLAPSKRWSTEELLGVNFMYAGCG